MIDLSRLPAPDVVEPLDYETILAQLLADYRARWPEFSAWVESDPALKLLEVAAYRELLLRARVNDAARAVMLAHAAGADLDNLAALFAVERLAGEDDAALRARVTASLGAHNTAGSAAGYEYWARSAGADMVCVRRLSRDPAGTLRIWIGGAVTGEGAAALDARPSLALYRAVEAVLERPDVRPITDTVTLAGIGIHPYVVAATVSLDGGAPAEETRAAAEASLRAVCIELHHCVPPNNNVSRERLIAALFVPGVRDATLTAPAADVAVFGSEAAWPTTGASNRISAAPVAADPVRLPMDGVTVTVA